MQEALTISWTCSLFNALNASELYAIMQLRNEVFVVEQNCVYQDADGKDAGCWHFCGWENGQLAAYARLLPPGISYDSSSIGRVLVSPAFRNRQLGRLLMQKAIEKTFEFFGGNSITIGAQYYLLNFYSSLGFAPIGQQYLEDGIPHITMILKK